MAPEPCQSHPGGSSEKVLHDGAHDGAGDDAAAVLYGDASYAGDAARAGPAAGPAPYAVHGSYAPRGSRPCIRPGTAATTAPDITASAATAAQAAAAPVR